MKYLALFSTIIFLGIGCAQSPVLESDFIPIQGKATSPNGEDAATVGPFERQLKTAISYDGLTYISNDVWISAQANVPDAVITPDGDVYLYYSGWMVGDHLNTTAVAISQDNGKTWTYRYVEMENYGDRHHPVDPDVILLSDGTFRMYFTTDGDAKHTGIHYAESLDGITYNYKKGIFIPEDRSALDSTTFKIGNTWHMYALSEKGPDELWYLTSKDGITFELSGLTSFPFNGKSYVPTNGVWVGDKFHLMLFHPTETSIVSMWTKNGSDWYPGEGVRLEPTEDELYVKDPTIVSLPNNQKLMIYVTNTP